MDTKSVRCVVNSISRFVHLVSCQMTNTMPAQKSFRKIASLLKLLKPVLDDIVDYKIPSDEALYKECEELDLAVNEAREFMEGWSSKMSKICSVSTISIHFVIPSIGVILEGKKLSLLILLYMALPSDNFFSLSFFMPIPKTLVTF